MENNFSSIPVLDYSQVSNPDLRPIFIGQLRHVLINVGFLYLSNLPIADEDIQALMDYAPRLFAIPEAEKERCSINNSQHFLGYSRLGGEYTKGQMDQREQFDFASEWVNQWKPGDPEYLKLWGPPPWPKEELLPGFKATLLRYLAQLQSLTFAFIDLIEEAFELPPDAFDKFFDKEEGGMQRRVKVVKYPVIKDGESNQGVGPHYDAGFLTFLLQASPHRGLQVQNNLGEWIDAPPIPGTLVINIGRALETITGGLARATSHRVLSPEGATTPRYSVPSFQNVKQSIKLAEATVAIPPALMALKDNSDTREAINYSEYDWLPAGETHFIGKIKSHPDAARRHYPELFTKYFPQGVPVQAAKA